MTIKSASKRLTAKIDPVKATHALARIHYSFEESLADIIDNSIDANADNISIQLLQGSNGNISRIIVADNGNGMSSQQMEEAIVIGSNTKHSSQDLGKYGMGLKVASMNQTNVFYVLSKSLKSDFIGIKYEVFDDRASHPEWLVDSKLKAFEKFLLDSKKGTVVIWEITQAFSSSQKNIERHTEDLMKRIRHRLGIIFHKFIEEKKIAITVSTRSSKPPKQESFVEPINPFNYSKKTSSGYPKKFTATLPGNKSFSFFVHCWPAKSNAIEYRLPTVGASAAQGFYFYRNNRLIQIGGWPHRQSKTEPHTSLARIEVHLPSTLDHVFKVNVQKTAVNPPFAFWDAIENATSKDGSTWKSYMSYVKSEYSRKKDKPEIVAIPGTGISPRISKSFKNQYPGTEDFERISVHWKKLPPHKIFDLDTVNHKICINTIYKDHLLNKSNVEEVVNFFSFLLFKNFFKHGYLKKQEQKDLENLNNIFLKLTGE